MTLARRRRQASRSLRKLSLPPGVTCAWLAGSALGTGPRAPRDLDVVVVSAEALPVAPTCFRGRPGLTPDRVAVLTTRDEGTPLDVELWLERQVDQVLSLRDVEEPASMLTGWQLDLLHSVQAGAALAGGEWLAPRTAAVRASTLSPRLASACLATADALLDDALERLAVGDHETAALAARDGLDQVVDALTLRQGELAPSARWRSLRVRGAPPPPLTWAEYWDWQSLSRYEPERPERWILAVIDRARELMLDVSL